MKYLIILISLILLITGDTIHAQSVISNAVVANAVLNAAAAGGPFTFVASASGADDSGSTNTVSTSTTLNVATGDLIVALVGYEDDAGSTVSASDGGSNTLTLDAGDDFFDPSRFTNGALLYKLSAVANATATFTGTTSSNQAFKRIIVMQFRPASGETVTKDISGTREANGSGSAIASGTFSTTGTDVVVCGGAVIYTSGTWSNHKIASVAADQTKDQNSNTMWCSIETSALTTQIAEADYTGSSTWTSSVIAFKSQ